MIFNSLETKLLTKLQKGEHGMPIYLIGGNASGKTTMLKRLLANKEHTGFDDIYIFGKDKDVQGATHAYDDTYKSFADVFEGKTQEFIDCLTVEMEDIINDRMADNGYEDNDIMFTYNFEDDYHFMNLLYVLGNMRKLIKDRKHKVLFAIDNLNVSMHGDYRDLIIMEFLQCYSDKAVLLITSLHNSSEDDWDCIVSCSRYGSGREQYDIVCGDYVLISKEDAKEYRNFLSGLKSLKYIPEENEDFTKIESTKDIILVGGLFNKERDINELMGKLAMSSCGTLLVQDTEKAYIIGGVANRQWYNKVKSVDINKQDDEYLIFVDINGPLFKKCSFDNLGKLTNLFTTNNIMDTVADIIKVVR